MRRMDQVLENMLTLKTKIINLDQLWKIVFLLIINICIAYVIKDKLGGDPTCGLFAVFDGHGGKQVADHC
jgi:hypothetical protein